MSAGDELRVGRLRIPLSNAKEALIDFTKPGAFAYAGYDLSTSGERANTFTEDDLRIPSKMSTPPSRKTLAWLEEVAVPHWTAVLSNLGEPGPSISKITSPDLAVLMTELHWPLTRADRPRGRNTGEALHTKILHLKRPSLLPVFDTFLHRAYAGMVSMQGRYWSTIYYRRPENLARYALLLRQDVVEQHDALDRLRGAVAETHGVPAPTPLRTLDVVGWMALRRATATERPYGHTWASP